MKSCIGKMGLAAFAMAALLMGGRVAEADVVATDLGTVDVVTSGDADNALTVSTWTDNKGFAPVTSDNLLTKGTASLGSGSMTFGSQLKNINDGLMVSNGGLVGDTTNSAAFTSDSSLVFQLDNTYDLAEIDAFTFATHSRLGQKYTVYSSSNNGSSWTSLAAVDSPNTDDNGYYGVHGIGLGVAGMATGVNALKFVFSDPSGGQGTAVYSEIAAYGTVIPEPASLMLVVFGLIGILAYAWRRRK